MSAEDWTPERVQKLTVLWAQGLSCAQIARELGGGITRNAVIGKRVRMGLPDRAMPNRSYGKQGPRKRARVIRAIAAPSAPRTIRAAEPKRYSRAPTKGITATRFIDRSPSQCSMFCEGEEGALGYVCGAPAMVGVYCVSCAALIYIPTERQKREAA